MTEAARSGDGIAGEQHPQIWLPQRRRLALRARPQLLLVRELPAHSPGRGQLARRPSPRPPLGHSVRLHPRQLDLEGYELVAVAPPPPARARADERQARLAVAPEAGQSHAAAAPGPLAEPLSARERELLHALARGDTNHELAATLGIAVGTVRWHLTNIYGKLGVRRRTQAIARARDLRILPPDSARAPT